MTAFKSSESNCFAYAYSASMGFDFGECRCRILRLSCSGHQAALLRPPTCVWRFWPVNGHLASDSTADMAVLLGWAGSASLGRSRPSRKSFVSKSAIGSAYRPFSRHPGEGRWRLPLFLAHGRSWVPACARMTRCGVVPYCAPTGSGDEDDVNAFPDSSTAAPHCGQCAGL